VKAFIAGLILGILFPLAAVYLYFESGAAPVATSAPPMPLEKFFANMALHATLEKEAPQEVPIKADETTYADGAQIYREHCAICHGLLNQPVSLPARGMFPHPPQLLKPEEGVTGDPPGETFWIAKHGIRLSGMPSFSPALSDKQLWQVSLLLANADKLPASTREVLSRPD
jgi:mono/diheme cytochrome c family protein